MDITINDTVKDLVYKLQFSSDLTAKDIVTRLEAEDWIQENYNRELNTNRQNGARFVLAGTERGKLSEDIIKDHELKRLYKAVTSQSFKMLLLEKLFQTESFLRLWGIKNIYLFNRLTTLTANFVVDNPGCTVKIHLDNRMLVATGMLYINEKPKDQGLQATVFYSDVNRNNPVFMETGFGNGWFAVNMQDNWHEGFNKSNEKRYSILLGLELNVEHLKKDNSKFDVNISNTTKEQP